MNENNDNRNLPVCQSSPDPKNHLLGYPSHPTSEDIYNHFHEEKDLNPENISENKSPNEANLNGVENEDNLDAVVSGNDLDVPGSELDDAMEDIGSEDEENNYYSLGGENHSDLDENQG
ncbi:MAG: hypothetical protein WCR72_06475 [Bacteroidota bacterium]